MKKKLSTSLAESEIIKFIRSFYEQYLKGKHRRDLIDPLQTQLAELDNENPEYQEKLLDQREHLMQRWLVLFAIVAVIVDFVVLFQAVQVFCEGAGLPYYVAFLIPVFFIVIEVLLSFFQLRMIQLGSSKNWLGRNLQYLILLLIGTLLLSVIIYSLATYNPTTDGNYIGYVLSVVLPQIGLFVFSCLLHVAIIKYSREIFEAFGFFRYIRKRKKITEDIKRIKDQSGKDIVALSAKAQEFTERKETFLQHHPDTTLDFEKITPAELKDAINVVMGRSVFLQHQPAAV